MIWSKVTENTKSGRWHLAGALIVDENPVFDTEGDELECYWNGCRNKTIHAIGSVAKVKWQNLGGHPYTGIFKGANYGFTRWSSAAPASYKNPSIRPGMGVKFLRSGVQSANFVAMYSVDGQDVLNWFANDFTSQIPAAKSVTLKPLEAHFADATKYIQSMGMSDMAAYTEDGTAEASPVFPWNLRFQPTGEIMFPNTLAEGARDNFMDDLATIPAGSVLYDVYAQDKPTELGGTEQLIAKLVSDSTFTSSNWGDEHLFFRHQRYDDDLVFHPEWEPYVPRYEGFFKLQQEATSKPGCPFRDILDYLQ